jgi:hypothetical protein
MPVDGGPKVVHDLLADNVREPGLDDAEDSRDDGDRDQPEDEERQKAIVVSR